MSDWVVDGEPVLLPAKRRSSEDAPSERMYLRIKCPHCAAIKTIPAQNPGRGTACKLSAST